MTRCITTETARERMLAALDVIDSSLTVLRDTPSDAVGNKFRVRVAERLETQQRASGGLSYRMFGELFVPPDGPDPTMVEDASLRDVLWARLRITPAEIRRRARMAARIAPRRSLRRPPHAGAPRPQARPELRRRRRPAPRRRPQPRRPVRRARSRGPPRAASRQAAARRQGRVIGLARPGAPGLRRSGPSGGSAGPSPAQRCPARECPARECPAREGPAGQR